MYNFFPTRRWNSATSCPDSVPLSCFFLLQYYQCFSLSCFTLQGKEISELKIAFQFATKIYHFYRRWLLVVSFLQNREQLVYKFILKSATSIHFIYIIMFEKNIDKHTVIISCNKFKYNVTKLLHK